MISAPSFRKININEKNEWFKFHKKFDLALGKSFKNFN